MSLGKKYVLVVDDEPAILEVYREIFDDRLIELVCCEDGISALREAKARHFDLIITDINMPQLDGRLLISCIRFDSLSKDAPIIVVSSEVSTDLSEKIGTLNIATPVKKPFHVDELVRAVNSLLFREHRKIVGVTELFQQLLTGDAAGLFEFYLHDKIGFSPVYLLKDNLSFGCQTSFINLWGKVIFGGLWLSFSENFLQVIAEKIFGSEYVTGMGLDGIKDITNEFLNQIAGNLRTKLMQNSTVTAIGVPYLIEGKGQPLLRCVTSPVFGFDLIYSNEKVGRLDVSLGDPQLIGEGIDLLARKYFVFEEEKSPPMLNSA